MLASIVRSVMASIVLSGIVQADDWNAGDTTGAVLGGLGLIVGLIALGRRREEGDDVVGAVINTEMCAATASHFADEHFQEFIEVLAADGSNAVGLETIAVEMAEWCAEMGERRRMTQPAEDDHLEAYLSDFIKRFASADVANRRLASEGYEWIIDHNAEVLNEAPADLIPASTFSQCRGYSIALAELAKVVGDAALDVFAVNANGDGSEQLEGCKTVVNSVNDALAADLVDGFEIEEDKDGKEVVVVTNDAMIDALGTALTSVVLASGVFAVKLMDICHYYQEALAL